MMRYDLSGDLRRSPQWNMLANGVREGLGPFAAFGVGAQLCAAGACALRNETGRNVLAVTASEESARRLFEDVQAFGPGALWFPARPIELRPLSAQSGETVHARVRVLSELQRRAAHVIVASVEAVLPVLAPPKALLGHMHTLRPAMQVDVDDLLRALIQAGYERVVKVEGPGQVALRGGILDVFAVSCQAPVRAEWFGGTLGIAAQLRRGVAAFRSAGKIAQDHERDRGARHQGSGGPRHSADRAGAFRDGLSGAYAAEMERWIGLFRPCIRRKTSRAASPVRGDGFDCRLPRRGGRLPVSRAGADRGAGKTFFEEFIGYYNARKKRASRSKRRKACSPAGTAWPNGLLRGAAERAGAAVQGAAVGRVYAGDHRRKPVPRRAGRGTGGGNKAPPSEKYVLLCSAGRRNG